MKRKIKRLSRFALLWPLDFLSVFLFFSRVFLFNPFSLTDGRGGLCPIASDMAEPAGCWMAGASSLATRSDHGGWSRLLQTALHHWSTGASSLLSCQFAEAIGGYIEMASSVLPFGRSELCLQEKGRKRSGERDKTLLGGLIISYAHEKERERNMFFFVFFFFFLR